MLSAILQTVNVRLAPAAIGFTLRQSGAATLFYHDDFKPLADALLPGLQIERTVTFGGSAADGFEALIEIGERRPDVLITDLGVAGLDFFRMVHFLRDHARERLMVVVLVASEADRAGVREPLPEDVAVLGLPAESANLAARVWALLKDGP